MIHLFKSNRSSLTRRMFVNGWSWRNILRDCLTILFQKVDSWDLLLKLSELVSVGIATLLQVLSSLCEKFAQPLKILLKIEWRLSHFILRQKLLIFSNYASQLLFNLFQKFFVKQEGFILFKNFHFTAKRVFFVVVDFGPKIIRNGFGLIIFIIEDLWYVLALN